MSRSQEASALRAAIAARFFRRGEWQAWADRRMLEEAAVPSWLFDLSGASTPEEAMSALEECRREAEQSGAPSGIEPDLVSLRLGFSFLRYRNGEIDLAALLTIAGELADAANYCDPSCEAFFLLLNAIDGGGPTQPRSEPLTDRAEALFRPHITAVEHWLAILAVQGEQRDQGRDPTPDLKQSVTAELYRLALLLGLEQPSSVADWANGVIDATETADLRIVDLALVGSNVGELALVAQGIKDGPAAEQALREFLMEEAGIGEDP